MEQVQEHTNLLTRSELEQLMRHTNDVCVSLFMPTNQVRPEKQQEDRIRLKNLLQQAKTQIMAFAPDLRTPSVEQLLEPAARLIENGRFWQYQSDGLAVFLSNTDEPAHQAHIYRLPLTFETQVVVANRFIVKPLLPLFTGNGRFYILALSQNHVRLLQGTRDSIGEVEVPGLPANMAEALWLDDPEKQLQWHTTTQASGPAAFRGRRSAGD